MSSPADLPGEINFTANPEASPARMDTAMAFLYALIRAATALQPEFRTALADLQANGLERIAGALAPVYTQASTIAAQLAAIEAAYLTAGVRPSILLDAATAAAAQLTTYKTAHDVEEQSARDAAVLAFAAKTHGHAIADVAGLRAELDQRHPGSVDLFVGPGVWTRPAGLVAVTVICIGGGGGGGSGAPAKQNDGTFWTGGGGGGGGGFSQAHLIASQLAATETIDVGSGGAGGAASTGAAGNPGGTGGSTGFGALLRAGGGAGGGGGSIGLVTGGIGGDGMSAGGQGSGYPDVGGIARPVALGAGGGGRGAGHRYEGGGTIAPAAGQISTASPWVPILAAGLSLAGAHMGAGGGGGGGMQQAGFAGGSFGGGGGGGGFGGIGNASGAGGAGGGGACLIISHF